MVREKELLEALRLSPASLAHLERLCDSAGLRQHAIHGVPLLKSGYTVDDNARALIASLEFGQLFQKGAAREHCVRFLSFLNFMQKPNGWFRNLLSFDRRFIEERGSSDCFGRAVWASSRAANSWLDENYRLNAWKMVDSALPLIPGLQNPRPIAFALLGLSELAKTKLAKAQPKKELLLETINRLGSRLVEMFELNSNAEWQWFEDILTYDNARMPQALFACFQATGNKRFLGIAEKSFQFLTKNTIGGEMFEPVGQEGWFPRCGKKALFDQQPIEAASMVQAAVAGFFATSNDDYKKTALTCYNWFFGGNSLGAALYDRQTGACFDGLTPKGVNLNQGAESLVELMLARFSMERMHRQKI